MVFTWKTAQNHLKYVINEQYCPEPCLSRLLLLLLLITLHRLHCSLLSFALGLLSVILVLTPVPVDIGDHV